MASNILIFPTADTHRTPRYAQSDLTQPASLNSARRIHLCDCTQVEAMHDKPTHDKQASRTLDLGAQVDLTVSHVHRRITENAERARQRHFFHPVADTPNIPA